SPRLPTSDRDPPSPPGDPRDHDGGNDAGARNDEPVVVQGTEERRAEVAEPLHGRRIAGRCDNPMTTSSPHDEWHSRELRRWATMSASRPSEGKHRAHSSWSVLLGARPDTTGCDPAPRPGGAAAGGP